MGRRQKILFGLGTAIWFLLQLISGLYSWDSINWKGWTILSGATIGFTILNFYANSTQTRPSETEERTHALSVLAELTYKLLNVSSEVDLRVTLLKVNLERVPIRLEQMVRYTATGRRPGESSMAISQGIAGLCYRSLPLTIKLQPCVTDFVRQMIDLGFTHDEARQFRQDRKTYLCCPVLDQTDKIVAVLSLDAKVANLFTPERIEIAVWTTPFFARLLVGPTMDGG